MTSNNPNDVSPTHVSPMDVEKVDSFSRKLYKRARNAGPNFEEIATVVRTLHTVLKHLKVESEDPESLLNDRNATAYLRYLRQILEDTEFRFKQLDTILEKYGGNGSGSQGDAAGGHGTQMDGEKGWMMLGSWDRDLLDMIRRKLLEQHRDIGVFLDTIQLHNPSKSGQFVGTSNANLDAIKDKVDAIASRLYQRRNSNLDDKEELWEQFRDELEKEGFSSDVLRKHQDVIRAYIRQLDEQLSANGGSTPSVRGLLVNYQPPADDEYQRQAAPYPGPYPVYPPAIQSEQKERYGSIDNEKYFPSANMERLQEEKYPPTSRHPDHDGTSTEPMALMSTRDLMALDKREADLAIAMGNMHLYPPTPANAHYNMSGSPSTIHYLPSSGSQPAIVSSSPPANVADQLAVSPRDVPSIVNQQGLPALPAAQQYSRLAPDSQGRDIPLDAKWTRIPRELVSPETLREAGVRFEARPDFVAILGTLTREEVGDLAKRTVEIRNSRRQAGERRERRTSDRYHPDKYRNWDVIQARRQRDGRDKSAGGDSAADVVGARDRQRADSPASSELYDSSSDEYETSVGYYNEREPVSTYGSSPSPRHRASAQAQSQPQSHPKISDPKHDGRTRARADNVGTNIDDGDDNDKTRTKVYPFIVPPPKDDEGASPAATVKPKPILKNKGEDPHVRFDPEPQILDDSSLPRSSPPRRSSTRDRDRDREKRYHSDRYADRDRERERHPDRDRDRDRDRNRTQDRDREEYPHRHRRSHRYHSNSSGGGSSRRDRDRDYVDNDYVSSRRKDDRAAKRRARDETLRAVGIGGAAASLLSVLAEAASNF
ncbi:hypothetical protein F4779DRAFT_621180 [Xylariaceae sp. FL0662B]|nr:hypothetical protein F4779DRAFT_621180 [Xylariaceae sp. FL0662B]